MSDAPSIPYRTRVETRAAFDLVGYTQIVTSGGALYDEARRDGRWEALRALAGADGTIYGVASVDKECPKDHYRYTLAVVADPDKLQAGAGCEALYRLRIKASAWLVFALDHFGAQYGTFWGDDPYRMTAALGWTFNTALGLHIDAYPPSCRTGDDAIEFWMPVKRPARESTPGE